MKIEIKNNKFLKTAVLSVLAILLGFLLARYQPAEDKQMNNANQKNKIEISGVMVNKFIQEREKDKDFVTLEKTKDYHVFYIPEQALFYISITSYPFDEHREAAEAIFIKKLGITEEQACNLNVDLTTPAFANPEYAGKVYELSWCNEQK